MNDESREKVRLLLADDGPGRIYVDLEAFFDFSFYMAEELEDLIAMRKLRAAQPRTVTPAVNVKF